MKRELSIVSKDELFVTIHSINFFWRISFANWSIFFSVNNSKNEEETD